MSLLFSGSQPETVTYGNPNEGPGNPYGMGAGGSAVVATATVSPSGGDNQTLPGNQKKPAPSFWQRLVAFMNTDTGTILTTGCAMAIGGAFKDLASSIINNLLQPLILQIIVMLNLNSVYDFQSLVTTENNVLNFKSFLNSFFTFAIVLLTVYLLNQQISKLANGGKII